MFIKILKFLNYQYACFRGFCAIGIWEELKFNPFTKEDVDFYNQVFDKFDKQDYTIKRG